MKKLMNIRKALLTSTLLISFVLLSCDKSDEDVILPPSLSNAQTVEQLKIALPNDALTHKLMTTSENWLLLALKNAKSTSFIHHPEKANDFIAALDAANGDKKQVEALLNDHFNNVPLLMDALNKQSAICVEVQTKYLQLAQLNKTEIEELKADLQTTLIQRSEISLASAADCAAERDARKADCLQDAVIATTAGGVAGGGVGALIMGVAALVILDNCYGTQIQIY